MLCLELVVALLGVANYLEGASCVFRCLRLYLYFITDLHGPASECASTLASWPRPQAPQESLGTRLRSKFILTIQTFTKHS